MNKFNLLLSLLKYSITNPYGGMNLLQSRYQVYVDSKNKHLVQKFENVRSDVQDIINELFPSYNSSILKQKQNLLYLEKHIEQFFKKLDKEIYPSKTKPYPPIYGIDKTSGFFLYILCKILKPEKIIETGVAYGLTSAYILQALHENKKGTLYSIDYVFRPWESKSMIGALIPDNLRDRWKLIYGSSSQKLKKLLISLGSVDIFFHDSLHTFDNMTFEFNTAWPFIRKEGFLLSDDIASNAAFYEFYSKMNLKSHVLVQKNKEKSFLGIITQPDDLHIK